MRGKLSVTLLGVGLVLSTAVLSSPPLEVLAAAAPTISVSGNHLVDSSGNVIQLRGVNRSGAEYACAEGWGIWDGPTDDDTSIGYMLTWKINAVRIPLNEDCWLGINGVNPLYSGSTYISAVVDYVNRLNAHGIIAIPNLHFSAPGTTVPDGQSPMADRDHSNAFWSSVATTFKNNHSVLFDLFNEPYPDNNQDTAAAWSCVLNGGTCSGVSFTAAGMQEMVNAVRATGATQPLMIAGPQYAGMVDQWTQYKPSDPLNQLVASIHIYGLPLDSPCRLQACWDATMGPLAMTTPIVIGELGDTDCTSNFSPPLMTWADAHGISYTPWAWNTANCANDPSLISDYTGTPTAYGVGVRDHFLAVAASPVPAVGGLGVTSGPVSGGTSITVSGTNFTGATAVNFGGTPAASFTVQNDTTISAVTPAHCPGTVDVRVSRSGGTSSTSAADQFTFNGGQCMAASRLQYRLTGNDGVHWQDIDANNLSVTITPAVNSIAILGGNADLWTANAGFNQDLAITVNGTVAAWKESGGFAGTFSPNAAYAQAVVSMTAGTTYTVKLQWKTNKPEGGATIFAGAGAAAPFSPTTLTASLVPASTGVPTAVSTSQYQLTRNDGSTWTDIDATSATPLKLSWTPATSGTVVITGNADLWTASPGVNQDLGINVNGSIAAWKESGGFAGTFSPNAAMVQAAVPVTAGTAYTIKLQWKANVITSGTIFAAAGGAAPFSPSRLTVQFFPGGTGLTDVVSNQQYTLTGNNGSSWQDTDAAHLSLTIPAQSAGCLAILSANADLWTANAGYNQDLAITVNATVAAWHESGGFAGTFSPNAAFVQTVVPLAPSASTAVKLQWKTNKPEAVGSMIAAGAGPLAGGSFSPTRLTAAVYCS